VCLIIEIAICSKNKREIVDLPYEFRSLILMHRKRNGNLFGEQNHVKEANEAHDLFGRSPPGRRMTS
jgi:hypothetical protein